MQKQKKPLFFNPKLVEKIGTIALTVVAFLTVAPIIAIVIYIIYLGVPAINWEFLTAMPMDGMRAGGIWPAIIGTFYLTIGTAIFAVPLGVAAAVYLSEYASDNRLTGAYSSGDHQSGRNSFCSLWFVWSWAVCHFSQFWHQYSFCFFDALHYDLASHHQYYRRSVASRSTILPCGEHFIRGNKMANNPTSCFTAGIARHIDGNSFGVGACCRRDSSYPFYRSGVFPSKIAELAV